jgi:ATP-dependent helicase/nuclease subunit B
MGIFLPRRRLLRDKEAVRARFLLGPAGAGKTFRCLEKIRAALTACPEGPPLIFLAPKQATFQLERQLLSGPGLAGYTRLHILSFERLAKFMLDRLRRPLPPLLSEEGRVMVLRALLARRRGELRLFRGSAGLAGFARQLSLEMRELQRREISPEMLAALAARPDLPEALRGKLRDIGLLQRDYLDWLKARNILDSDCLLEVASQALSEAGPPSIPDLAGACLWLDGFGDMTPQELSLLAASARFCDQMTLAFCVEGGRTEGTDSWLSIWSGIAGASQDCWKKLAGVPGLELEKEFLDRAPGRGRFAENPVLAHLEKNWESPKPFPDDTARTLRLVTCANPEGEAVLAAREILRLVRGGGRYREAAVLLRTMEGYDEVLRRIFSRYQIPFFLDRRESSAHHPLAELTRNALRLVAFDWRHEDWFGALKTGLVSPDAAAIDRMENEALARGWKGTAWTAPFPNPDGKLDGAEQLRQQWVVPFLRFRENLAEGGRFRPTGTQLAGALRELWRQLQVEDALARLEGSADQRLFHPQLDSTVWRQMNAWLDDLDLAFAGDSLSPSEWLAILEAGLSGLTVGVIPPALDQVLIGTVDRSRNPDLKLALVLGVNESVFPAPPPPRHLLTESDCAELQERGVKLGPGLRQILSRERFFGYIACTRARERLVLTCAQRNAEEEALNPSPFFSHLQRLFPKLEVENFAGPDESLPEHVCELIPRLLRAENETGELAELLQSPAFASARRRRQFLADRQKPEKLSPELAARLYGPALRTSVSRIEQYAACAFRFFVNSGLQAEERRLFELDARQKGSFQHLALSLFHEQLQRENKTWHSLTPDDARRRMVEICAELAPGFESGLLAADPASRFAARTMGKSLENFVAAMVAWMPQYEFEPAAVEVEFGGTTGGLPGWELDLGQGRRLIFRGRIDRIDLCPLPGSDEALAVVIDYKSSLHKLDPVLLRHGIQLQLPAYLDVLRGLRPPAAPFGPKRLLPAGVFYINLRGNFQPAATRRDVLQNSAEAWQSAYKHSGRFDLGALPHLDNRAADRGTQFNFRLKKDGQPYATIPDPMDHAQFKAMLDQVEGILARMGREVFAGEIALNPFQKGTARACDRCEYQGICRIDPWTHGFRQLAGEEPAELA